MFYKVQGIKDDVLRVIAESSGGKTSDLRWSFVDQKLAIFLIENRAALRKILIKTPTEFSGYSNA